MARTPKAGHEASTAGAPTAPPPSPASAAEREDERKLHAEIMQDAHQQALSTLARTIAHELNQPLSAASNYIGAVREIASDEAGLSDLLDKAAAQIRRAADVLRSLRESVETGEMRRAPEPLNELVTEAVALAARRDDDAEIVLALDPAGPFARVDRVQIQQIVLNLLRNALEAVAGLDRARVTISTSCPEPGWVEIAVADSGAGFSGEAEPLFEPFYTTKPVGMGLGLTISRSIAERHDGRLTAHRRPDGGAAFRVRLPQSPAP